MEKVGDNLLLQFSNFSFDRVAPDSEWSVRGELCSANHKKEEEEEERSGDKLLRREPVLSRFNGLTTNPTKIQARRTPVMQACATLNKVIPLSGSPVTDSGTPNAFITATKSCVKMIVQARHVAYMYMRIEICRVRARHMPPAFSAIYE